MDVFQEYKPIRNKIALLARDDALAVVWAYCQFLQLDNFRFPKEIEVSKKFVELDTPQKWISEWELEVIAKEVILNSGAIASKARSLRSWKTLADIVNSVRDFENRIYREFGSQERVLVELIRLAHRQFVWQANPPNSRTIIRYFKIFDRPVIDEICVNQFGLNVWQTYMCGVACMGHFLSSPAIDYPLRSDIKALPPESFDKFFRFTCASLSALKSKLKDEQKYDESFAYAYNSLRSFPLVRMQYQGKDAIVCPLMTLLFWRFTGGLYYQLISDHRFANEFGDGFQEYVGETIERACPDSKIRCIPEHEYVVGKQRKRTVDWIIADNTSAVFLECKARRISLGAKISLTDETSLNRDIDNMASAVVQVYRTLSDYLRFGYPKFEAGQNQRIYPTVVTVENWRMFGPVMLKKLAAAVNAKLLDAGLSQNLQERFPYSVLAVEELELALQVINYVGVEEFMDGKIRDAEMSGWDWRGYMTNRYAKFFPLKALFDKEYDEMFSELFAAQKA